MDAEAGAGRVHPLATERLVVEVGSRYAAALEPGRHAEQQYIVGEQFTNRGLQVVETCFVMAPTSTTPSHASR